MNHINKLLHAGRVHDALNLLTEQYEKTPQQPDVLGYLAWCLRASGKFSEAVARYDELIALRPQDREAHRRRWETVALAGDTQAGIRGLATLLAEDPTDVEAAALISRLQSTLVLSPPPAEAPHPAYGGPQDRFTINDVINRLEQDASHYPASMFPDAARFLYSLVRILRPTTVAEIGCNIGLSTTIIAQALNDNGGGHIHAFDLFTSPCPPNSAVLGPVENLYAAASGHVAAANLSHRVTFHAGDSSTGITKVFSNPPFTSTNHPIDFAFVDGDHEMKGVLKDIAAIDPFLKPGGIMLLHDTIPKRCAWAGPREVIEDIAKFSANTYFAINLPTPEGFGFGLIQKLGGDARGPWAPSLWNLFREYRMQKYFHYSHRNK